MTSLGRRVDAASLAVFRILFGLLMAAGMIRFQALGWIDEFYVRPEFHFTWALASWVHPLPPLLMHAHFVGLTVLACLLAIGFHSRIAAAAFCIGFTYVELIDKSTYLNHYYLVSLLSGLLAVAPAHQTWSVDAWRRPARARTTIAVWPVYLLRFQLAAVYVFAGLAKLDADWLLEAQPLRMWLAARSDMPILGELFLEPWVAFAFSWFGAPYDLTIVFFLLWHRTRVAAFVTVVVFHTLTWVLFPIGMFPWIMIVATTIFFPPDWPRAWMARIGFRPTSKPSGIEAVSPRLIVVLVAYCVIQIAVPLRSYWPGTDPNWTGRGFNFAWRVMLVEKSGHTQLIAEERATGRRWLVPMRQFVTERQERMMAQDPFMIRALARHVADDARRRGLGEVVVRTESYASLNQHPAQRLINPDLDLAGDTPAGWILPLDRSDAAGGTWIPD